MIYAAQFGHLDIVDFLLEKCDETKPDIIGHIDMHEWTALDHAKIFGHREVEERLVMYLGEIPDDKYDVHASDDIINELEDDDDLTYLGEEEVVKRGPRYNDDVIEDVGENMSDMYDEEGSDDPQILDDDSEDVEDEEEDYNESDDFDEDEMEAAEMVALMKSRSANRGDADEPMDEDDDDCMIVGSDDDDEEDESQGDDDFEDLPRPQELPLLPRELSRTVPRKSTAPLTNQFARAYDSETKAKAMKQGFDVQERSPVPFNLNDGDMDEEDIPLSALKRKRSPKVAASKPVTEKPVVKEEPSENPQCSYCGSKKYTYHGIKAHLRTCMKKHNGVVKFPPKDEQNEITTKPQPKVEEVIEKTRVERMGRRSNIQKQPTLMGDDVQIEEKPTFAGNFNSAYMQFVDDPNSPTQVVTLPSPPVTPTPQTVREETVAIVTPVKDHTLQSKILPLRTHNPTKIINVNEAPQIHQSLADKPQFPSKSDNSMKDLKQFRKTPYSKAMGSTKSRLKDDMTENALKPIQGAPQLMSNRSNLREIRKNAEATVKAKAASTSRRSLRSSVQVDAIPNVTNPTPPPPQEFVQDSNVQGSLPMPGIVQQNLEPSRNLLVNYMQLPQPVPSFQVPNVETLAEPKEVMVKSQIEPVGEPLKFNAKPDDNQLASQMVQQVVQKVVKCQFCLLDFQESLLSVHLHKCDVVCQFCGKKFASSANKGRHEESGKCVKKGQPLNKSLPVNPSAPMAATPPEMPMTPLPLNTKKQVEVSCKYCPRKLRIQNVKNHEKICSKKIHQNNSVGTSAAETKLNVSPQQPPPPQQTQMVPVPPVANDVPTLPQKANDSQCKYCNGFVTGQTLAAHEEHCAKIFAQANLASGILISTFLPQYGNFRIICHSDYSWNQLW